MAEARIIDGRTIAAGLQRSIAEATAALRVTHEITPGLAAVLVGDDPASQVYVRNKARACTAAGLASFEHRLPANCGLLPIVELLARLNADERVDGILVQLPLPAPIDRRQVIAAIDPAKDVDGFHPVNVGRLWNGEPGLVPCTPAGCMILLRGDVEFDEVAEVAGAITPVPGGVGPMTIAMLLANTLTAARMQQGFGD